MTALLKHPGEQPAGHSRFNAREKTLSMYNYQQLTRTRATDEFYRALDTARLVYTLYA
jgi:hypothetical protein